MFTCANALMTSMSGFIVGGSFLALALNDLTWLTFALVAALDRISQGWLDSCEPAALAPSKAPVALAPLAFRAVPTYASPARMGR